MCRKAFRAFLCFFILAGFSMASEAAAAGSKEGHVCDVEFVAERIGDPRWVILDGRGGEEYREGHIPGAVNFGKPVVNVLKHSIDGRVASAQEIEKRFSQIGLSNDKGLIIYGKKGDYHVVCEQIPLYYGVKEYYFLDGGYEAWEAAGKKSESGTVTPVPAVFKAKLAKPELYLNTEQMLTVVMSKDPKVTLIDTRSPKEFNAEENTVLRGGRIPGAVNIPVDKNLDPETGKFLPIEQLKALYKNIPKDNKIILYCHRGCRTAFSFYALENLGYKDIAIYEDGYVVWGARADTPVENEHYVNMRPIVLTLEALKNRVEELEAKIK